MSYEKKISGNGTDYGQYIQVAGLGADPWAEAASGEIAPVVGGTQPSSGGGLFDMFFGGGTPTPAPTPAKPSTTSQVGAGIGAFLKGLSAPPVRPPTLPYGQPYPQPGMSPVAKLALVGGGALLLVVLLTRD